MCHQIQYKIVYIIRKTAFCSCLLMGSLNAQSLVFVGNLNNSSDSNGRGSVDYSYWIGKYETTISEYTTFLNNAAKADSYGLWYGDVMDITRTGTAGSYAYFSGENANTPVTWVNWFDAARYVNWLHNGANQYASTEDGAYTLNGATSGLLIKNSDARYWLPSFDEWYKAAFYDPNKTISGGYWNYATKTDLLNTSLANYQSSGPSEVGSYGNPSAYGTFDQSGNVSEWLSPVDPNNTLLIGGGWNSFSESLLSSAANGVSGNGGYQDGGTGFRIASSVPEPSALSLLAVGLGVVLRRRRRAV